MSAPGGVSALGGGACSWGGVFSQGVVSAPGGSASGGCLLPRGGVSQHALRQTPPLWTESQTPVKTLPWPNFVAAGKNQIWCILFNHFNHMRFVRHRHYCSVPVQEWIDIF